MTRVLLWLHAWLTALLVRFDAIDSDPVYLPQLELDAPPTESEADAELPPEILDALASWREPARSTQPVSQREQDAAPKGMPSRDTRFVVWSRGHVVLMTDSGAEAAKAFSNASLRAGIHQLWDRDHHASVPRGLRDVRVIPLEVR